MKAAIYTLGCKVNQYETQEMISSLKNSGFTVVDTKENADIYIINSCTVTAESSRKTRQAVRRFRSDNPDAVIVLTGCFSQAFKDEAIALHEADIILGNKTNSSLIEKIEEYMKHCSRIIDIVPHNRNDTYKGLSINSFEGHTRAFIKIQDGCNRYCSYCIIPKARGFSRSRPLDDIKKEIEKLASLGYKEIVFVGINLSSYGLDNGTSICDALQIAEETSGIERFRLGSLEPDHITDEVIERLAEMKKFCPQFHLSLQSGSNKILKRMNRHYTAEEYFELCEKLKLTFKDISLTTDIIVGFPGETEEDFNETLSFAKKCEFMKVHVFPFSPREGTPAYNYPDKIQNSIKNNRCAVLQKECDKIRKSFMDTYVGKTVNVLFETPKGKLQQGYTENYTPVFAVSDENLCGKIIPVKISEICENGCKGTIEK
ncbi:MAG: tRNA (N(6)-L-threonylcarbamoyladenosine(37)-C(2))-methylthiotransferase MtaB [Clostridia bacterium]|nr:tRNA (N(6)-L-threonylcarbamoyladenosine(37)-C(2))-methylthiotransferase MtaB [Clostridia bacterium]